MTSSRPPFDLDPPARRALERILRGRDPGTVRAPTRGRPPRAALRARILLLAAEGLSNRGIAKRLQISRPTVILWRRRFVQSGAAALAKDAPRTGRPRVVDSTTIESIVRAARDTVPFPATRWTVRAMAAAYGVSRATVHRIFRKHGVRPTETHIFTPTPEERLW